jgi:hypothetical protein
MDKRVFDLGKLSYNDLSNTTSDIYIPISYENSRMQTAVLTDIKEYIIKDLSYQVSYLTETVNNLQEIIKDLSTWKYN